MEDPIHQFNIVKYVTFGHIGGHEIAFTNSALFMAIAVTSIALLLIGGTSRRSLVPGRLQSLAEMSYEFVADTIRSWHHGRIPATRSARGRELFTRLAPRLLTQLADLFQDDPGAVDPDDLGTESRRSAQAGNCRLAFLGGPACFVS